MIDTVYLVPLIAGFVFIVFGNRRRQHILLSLPAVSAAFLAFVDPAALVGLLTLTIPFFVIREAKDTHLLRGLSFKAALVCGIGLFFALKDYFGFGELLVRPLVQAFGPGAGALLGAIGLSFVIFRGLEYTVVSTVRGPDIPLSSSVLGRLWLFLGFCLAFCTVTSGPILRWRGFTADLKGDPDVFSSHSEMISTLHRLSNGLLKISLCSQPLLLLIISLNQVFLEMPGPSAEIYFLICIGAVIYLYFLYLNFSGFSDVMIASGRFVGLRVPENFDQPFSAYGILDFFNHWHLSVSQWFRDMVFTPVVRLLMLRGWRSNAAISMLAFLLTFSLLGLWHGRTWPFLLCGLMLGVGATVNQWYREIGYKRIATHIERHQFVKALLREWLRALTYYYIALAIMGLWLDAAPLSQFWTTTLHGTALASHLLLISGLALLTVATGMILRTLSVPLSRATLLFQSGGPVAIVGKLVLAIAVFQLLSIDGGSNFIYEGF